MPKREDEYWAGRKEPQGQGLCPFCGSSNVYYNERYESWRCERCEKSFPTPSYGPGGDFGKEARWFGKTTEGERRREFAEVVRTARANKRKESSRELPGWLIPAFVVFLLMMFGVVVWGLWGGEIADLYKEVTYQQPPFSKTFAGEQIHLVNSSDASDPTWQQLISFLIADGTDEKNYSVFSFPCGAFAEEVHNKAEAAGIRAAWVSIDFEDGSEGHALNAFNTVDKGLVYVDCTGKDVLTAVYVVLPSGVEQKIFGVAKSWDKITYIEIGKEYGIISLEVASSPTYTYYEQYKQRWQAFETALEEYGQKVIAFSLEVERYSQWLGGRILYEGSSEALRAEQWYQELSRQENTLKHMEEELDREGDSLGAFWESLGIVKKVEVYW